MLKRKKLKMVLLKNIPYVNFEQPWWSDSTVNELTYDEKAILAIGDFALSSIGRTFCMFYDKKQAENYGINDLNNILQLCK